MVPEKKLFVFTHETDFMRFLLDNYTTVPNMVHTLEIPEHAPEELFKAVATGTLEDVVAVNHPNPIEVYQSIMYSRYKHVVLIVFFWGTNNAVVSPYTKENHIHYPTDGHVPSTDELDTMPIFKLDGHYPYL